MSPTSAVFFRLLGALEDLVAQESMQLAGENFDAVRQTQERAAPLVDELSRLSDVPAIAAARPRLKALMIRRRMNEERLAVRIQQVRLALEGAESNRRRVAQIAPAYGSQSTGALRQLSARG